MNHKLILAIGTIVFVYFLVTEFSIFYQPDKDKLSCMENVSPWLYYDEALKEKVNSVPFFIINSEVVKGYARLEDFYRWLDNPIGIPRYDLYNSEIDIGLGNIDAAVWVIEFSTPECKYCKDFHKYNFKSIKEKYIDTGKVFWIIKPIPVFKTEKEYQKIKEILCSRDNIYKTLEKVYQ